MPHASTRASPESWPSDGTGLGPIEAAALARALGDAVAATAVAAAEGVNVPAIDGGAFAFDDEGTDPPPPQPAMRATAKKQRGGKPADARGAASGQWGRIIG